MAENVNLPGQAAYELAIDIVSLGIDSIAVYVTICVAFGGWFIASGTIRREPRFSKLRWWITGSFVASAGGVAFGANLLFDRAGDALRVARVIMEEKLPANENLAMNGVRNALSELYTGDSSTIRQLSFIFTLVLVALLLLMAEESSEARRKDLQSPSE